MLHLFDPSTLECSLPAINDGRCEDPGGAPTVTVLGSDMATLSEPERDPVVREIRLSVFTKILTVLGELEKRVAVLEAAIAELA